MYSFRNIFYLCLLGFWLLSPCSALALPLPTGNEAMALPSTFTRAYDFEGIVRLNNCSGSFIRFESSKESDKGLMLTNGHCFEGGFVPAGSHIKNLPSERDFAILDSRGRIIGAVVATELVYATMTGTDISIYRLDQTYSELTRQFGVRPLTISPLLPVERQPIEVISGYWFRGYACSVEAIVFELREDEFSSRNAFRYSRPGCETIGGTSGSPVIASGTRKVIAINSTGNDEGDACTLNNPCEVDPTGKVTYKQGYSYAAQTNQIYSCLSSTNEIDLAIPGCQLTH
jgi:hypothetical protein